ncbi:MAG: type II toxin-antitoxin system RatA family toxin [Neomegalonema sp.]|nr:type II toxin-antitoxin system RatA family toxin [Neomegalonema sp.]
MPTHSEKRHVPYTPAQMYDLVSDIERYPEFIPWTAGVRIRSRKPLQDGPGEMVDADMIVSFRVFRERFGSRVTLSPDLKQIDVAYLDGPFKHMRNRWRFTPHEDGGAIIDFFVDFEFRSWALQQLIGVVFDQAMRRVVKAFEERAEALYGAEARGRDAAS